MDIEILHEGLFASALVHLQPGETFVSESGALYRSSANVDVDVTTQSGQGGGFFSGLKRLLASEHFFLSTYNITDHTPGEVGLAPTYEAEVQVVQMDGSVNWVCAGGSYLGSSSGLTIDTKFQGFKGFLTGESLFFVHVEGQGDLIVNGFGRLIDMHVDEPLIVDTGHLVAFEDTLDYTVTKAARGWFQSWLSGEGFVMEFTGSGRILMQSHNPSEYGYSLGPLLPPRK